MAASATKGRHDGESRAPSPRASAEGGGI